MSLVGLDISRRELRAVELKEIKGGKKELVRVFTTSSPPNSLDSDAIIDLEAYSGALDKFFSESGFSTRVVAAALPESHVFTRVITVPNMNKKELDGAMKWEAAQYIPIPLEEVSFDYRVISDSPDVKSAGTIDVLLVASPLTLTRKYLKILLDAHLRVSGLETESIALVRSLVGNDSPESAAMIVNIGTDTTDIIIVSGGSIRFTRSISSGGESLVRAIMQQFSFDEERSREYLVSYGLEESALEGKIMTAIRPIFDVVVAEVKRSIAYYATHREKEPITRVILSGETATLPGVLVYMVSALGVEVQLANPWGRVIINDKFDHRELEDNGPRYAVAVGLALKEV